MEIKKQFKEDFENANKVDLDFDLDQLEDNTRMTLFKNKSTRGWMLRGCSILAVCLLLVGFCFQVGLLKIKVSAKFYKNKYSVSEIYIAESNSFKKLNNVSYPSDEYPTKSEISEEEVAAYNNFSSSTYQSILETSNNANMSYSIAGLYSLMNEMSCGTTKEDLKDRFDNLLGLDKNGRSSFYEKLIKANSFGKENSTIQVKNAAFLDNKYEYSTEFVNDLTKLYCEAYQLDFDLDRKKIFEWIDQALKTSNYIDNRSLEIDKETMLFLFSTFYFKNDWYIKYRSDKNIKDNFYLNGNDKVQTTFMKHSYLIDCYYDYGNYLSVTDYYTDKVASVTYLVPKKVDDNIYELTKGKNIFVDEEENKVVNSNPKESIMVKLTTPKFSFKTDIDLKSSLVNLGFEDAFDRNINSFDKVIKENPAGKYNVYLQNIKQRNEIEFNENGTIVRSLATASFGAGSAGVTEMNTVEVKLNQPFIYIIKDINGSPIFVGHVDNPKA